MTNQPLIELQNVSAGYDRHKVLHDVNMKVYPSDFVGVIGPNGGGKTTLLKVMLGLLTPQHGKVILHPALYRDGRQHIGYLPQVNQIDKKFPINVCDVVLSGLQPDRLWRTTHSAQQKRYALELMEQTGIAHLAKKPIGELSGGQMQRAFLCRAIIDQPPLLILDEPNTYVDNQFENQLYQTLDALNSTMAIVVVSHDMGTIAGHVRTIACVNRELHYHPSGKITGQQLAAYNCPIQLISHGDVPHTVLQKHSHQHQH